MNIGGATGGGVHPDGRPARPDPDRHGDGHQAGHPAGRPGPAPSAHAVDPGTQTLQPTPSITGTPRANTVEHRCPGHLGHRDHQDQPVVRRRRRDRRRHGDDVHADDRPDRSGADLRGHQHPARLHHGRQDQPGQDDRGAGSDADSRRRRSPAPPRSAHTLTGDPGTWDAGTALAYQWFADGAAIDGATGLTYDLTPAELGKAITFAVTSTKATYETVTKTSGPTAAVAAGDLVLTPVPTITGTPKVGVTLDRRPRHLGRRCRRWPYQWTVDGTDIAGATALDVHPCVGDLGKVDHREGDRQQDRLHTASPRPRRRARTSRPAT